MPQGQQGKQDEPEKPADSAAASASPRRKADPAGKLVMLCLGLGAWGVLSGYALFVLLREELQIHTPWATLAALLVAAAVTWFTEAVRERIDPSECPKASTRLPVMILMLGMFELFVSAWHGVSELGRGELVDSGLVLLGDELGSRLNAGWALVAMGILWVLEGAVLAAVLGGMVFSQKPQVGSSLREALRPAARNGGIGALAGAIAGAVGILITVLVMRVIAAVHFMATQPKQWIEMVQRAGSSASWVTWLIFKPVEYLSRLWTWGWWGPLLTILIVVMVFSYCRREKKWWPLVLLVIGMTAMILSPLLDNLGTVFLMMFLGALVWSVPGALLGASVPLLKGPAARPQFWSVAAFLAAAILGTVAIVRGYGPYLTLEVVGSALAALAGIVFWRGGSLTANWPLAALVLALFVGMATRVQQATFQGVLDKLSFLAQQPQYKGQPPPPPSPLDRLDRLKNLTRYGYKPAPQFHLDPGAASRPWETLIGSQAERVLSQPAPHPGTTHPSQRLTSRPAPTTAPASQPWQGRVGSLAERLLRGSASQPGLTLPAPSPPQPQTYADIGKLFQEALPADPSEAAARELRVQTGLAQNAREQAQLLLGDERVLNDYLQAINGRLEQVRQRQEHLREALAAYRKDPLKNPGTDPDQWPDRRAAVELLQLGTMEHRLDLQAQRVEELIRKHSPLLSAGQTFELTVTASLAFWVTVGLLIGWSQREREKQ